MASKRVAVIADPHFHDVYFGRSRAQEAPEFVRTLADTLASTRVFNESELAFRSVLDEIAARDIRLVVLAGDLTDDGQRANWRAVDALLQEYAQRYGMRFFATPGNHDQFAEDGCHLAKRFANADGSFDLVASNATTSKHARQNVVLEDMYCVGYADALDRNVSLGYFRTPGDVHWESPFGFDDALAGRWYEIAAGGDMPPLRITDASYLVEPVEGLWVLSLDANVYVAEAGVVSADRSGEGWNAVLASRPYLLAWVKDVTDRARRLGKQLLTFSHYPMVDVVNGTHGPAFRFDHQGGGKKREMPIPEVMKAFAAAGIGAHFSGHWHVNNTGCFHEDGDFLVNVAVPSPVGFPGGFKVVTLTDSQLHIETVPLGALPLPPAIGARYQAERGTADDGDIPVRSYKEFLAFHLSKRVRGKYLSRDWPEGFAILAAEFSLADVYQFANVPAALDYADLARSTTREPLAVNLPDLSFEAVLIDFHRLIMAGDPVLAGVGPERLAAYAALAAAYENEDWPAGSVQSDLAKFAGMMQRTLESAPAMNFVIDTAAKTVRATPIAAAPSAARQVEPQTP